MHLPQHKLDHTNGRNWQLKRSDVSIVRMVHALASETSPAHHLPLAKRSPAPSSLLRLSININVATTTTTTTTTLPQYYLSHYLHSRSVVPPCFLSNPRRRTQSEASKPSSRSRPSSADATNTRRSRQPSSSRFTYRHLAGQSASWIE